MVHHRSSVDRWPSSRASEASARVLQWPASVPLSAGGPGGYIAACQYCTHRICPLALGLSFSLITADRLYIIIHICLSINLGQLLESSSPISSLRFCNQPSLIPLIIILSFFYVDIVIIFCFLLVKKAVFVISFSIRPPSNVQIDTPRQAPYQIALKPKQLTPVLDLNLLKYLDLGIDTRPHDFVNSTEPPTSQQKCTIGTSMNGPPPARTEEGRANVLPKIRPRWAMYPIYNSLKHPFI